MRTKLVNPILVLAAVVLGPLLVSAQVVLDKDNNIRGSRPYAETVQRYLEKKKQKIVGGTAASDNAFPWQVSLGVSWIASPYDAHFCGGSVYSERWIITASH